MDNVLYRLTSRRAAAVLASALSAATLLAACGGGDEQAEHSERGSAETTSGAERPAEQPQDGVAITGIMGTIRQDQVENALNPRMQRFMRCFSRRLGTVEYLGGDIRLSFRIHTDGSVAWVFPTESNIGDRESEQCVIGVAQGTRFPRPRGGEAEFAWGFGFDADVRNPLSWDATALGTRADEVRRLARRCHASGGGYSVTAYIEPGGEVLAAGGTMPDHESDDALDCLLEGVRAMSMPDPGSYAAKIRFEVP